MAKSLEERVNELEKIVESQKKQIQRSSDQWEILNLVDNYEFKLGGGQFADVEKMFAQKTPGVKVQMMWGIYEGLEGVKRLFTGFHGSFMGEPTPGAMFMLMNTTPVIEVAGDGKTARAVFICEGHETNRFATGKLQAYWTYGRRSFDFVKEDGEWKIWHYTVNGGYMTPYEKSWVEGFEHVDYGMAPEYKPDKPPVNRWMYSPDAVTPYNPKPPEPYSTWDDVKESY